MKEQIDLLLRLNLEIEGALRVLCAHNNPAAMHLLIDKYDQFSQQLAQLRATANLDVPDAPAAPASIDDIDTIDAIDTIESVDTIDSVENVESIKCDEDMATVNVTDVPETEFIPEPEPEMPEPEPEPEMPEMPEPSVTPAAPTRLDEVLAIKNSKDLYRVFTINDKFRFIRGLFGEDKSDFEFTLAQLSEMNTLSEVYDYLLNDLGWDIDNEEVKAFISIVSNHFNAVYP